MCDSSDDTVTEEDNMAKLMSAACDAASHTDEPEKMQGYFKDRIIPKLENNVKVRLTLAPSIVNIVNSTVLLQHI